MSLPKGLTTVTPFSKYLALSLFVIFPILAFYLGVYYQQTVGSQKITSLQTNSPQESTNNSPFPVTVSQTKNLKLNTKIGPNMNAVTITFPDAVNTTYDKTLYHFKGSDFIVLDLHLNKTDIIGRVQELNEENPTYLDFVYEGQKINDAQILFKQLAQPVGIYPQTIYDGQYQIFTNKNGIKMKRQYSDVFGDITEKIEFTNQTAENMAANRYYSFETNDSILGKDDFDKTAFFNNPILWVKNNPQKNIQTLNTFIDTIKNIGY